MSGFDVIGYSASRKYTEETIEGAGAIKGDKGDPGPQGPKGEQGPAGIGTDGNPVGTVIHYFGETAPSGYLICNGAEYADADYPVLATLLKGLTTNTPFVGSDSDHFKVPDLRGEFLRGSGANSHENNGNGANVGVHQNGTAIPEVLTAYNKVYNIRTTTNANTEVRAINADCQYGPSGPQSYNNSSPQINTADSGRAMYVVRPTNTSVLMCIKAI